MAGSSSSRIYNHTRVQLACLAVLALTPLVSAVSTRVNAKGDIVDKIVYVSDDPAIDKWRDELSGAGIYPAHYALKAIDLLPLPHAPPKYMRVRRRNIKKQDPSIHADYRFTDQTQNGVSIYSRGRLESRRRKKKNKGGHDENGYDDGSWRGDKGDYGSEKKENGNGKGARKGDGLDDDSDGYGHGSDSNEEYDEAEDNAASEDEGSSRDSPSRYEDSDPIFKPYTEKAKYKSKGNQDAEDSYASTETTWRAPGSKGTGEDEDSYAEDSGDGRSDKPSKGSQGNPEDDETSSAKGSEDSYTSTGEGSSSDCTSLKRFFDDMGGTEWIDSAGWTAEASTSKACCRAFGVTCNAAGRVTALDLGANGLSGPLSPAVFELRYLTRLNVSANAISATLPDKFDGLPRLATVYLEQNSLKGNLPPSLQQSSCLSSVHISNNALEGPLAFPNARNLTQLYAARNRFTDLDISGNSALMKVALDDNQFNCTLPNIESLVDLQVFSVARNHFTGPPPIVTDLQKLVKLDLQANLLSGGFPDVTGLPRLQYLGLNGNSDLSGPFPTGKAPPNLVTCHVDTVLASSCPAQTVLADPQSLAAKCSVNCRGGGRPSNAVLKANTAQDTSPSTEQASQDTNSVSQKASSFDSTGQTPASLAQSLSGGDSKKLGSPALWIAGIIAVVSLIL